jgi:hypothetical protein
LTKVIETEPTYRSGPLALHVPRKRFSGKSGIEIPIAPSARTRGGDAFDILADDKSREEN